MPALLLIPGLPLAAFVILILIGRRLPPPVAGWVSVGALVGSCALTWAIGGDVLHGHRPHLQWPWLSAESGFWTIGLAVDGLTWLMLAVVTSIGTLIQLYAIGYMRGDPRCSRFFAYLSLFCASMLALVMADHFVLLYAGWELVGLCSYLLISFWFEKPSAAAAGRKAFITTRIGDTGLLLGIMLLAFAAGELHFDQLDAVRSALLLQHREFLPTVISMLIFFGAAGKSAQFPLHVWLPDAMEGPTPVSALIHAATMVAAGVYLVARTFPLFTPQSLAAVLGVGLFTHLAAGTIALTQTDIKRVLAYSTISQLGLMFTALGLGAMPLAMFHLTTHACFKALLFLGAGSVIHATHQQGLAHLGGLFRAMPVTAATFLVAALAMSGVFPLSGFWSKDAILLTARHEQAWVFWALLGGAVMTAGYIFRLYLRCFHGPAPTTPTAVGVHAQESPLIMTLPLMALAFGAAAVGLLGSPVSHQFFHLFGLHEAHEGLDLAMLAVSTAVAALGAWLAWTVGVQHRNLVPAAARPAGAALYRLAAHKYFVDEWYDRIIIQPFLRTAERLSRFDLRVIDAAVDRAGLTGWSVGQLKNWFDQRVVDRLVNGTAQTVQRLSRLGRRLQTGVVHHYLLVLTAAVVVLSACLRWF
ncbi:MAG: NADH-quinone oxidoreductase subunit L [Candidatus Omnitrophica bacterium]|nr:NADH-quinone oxidoreductase subunit L [Candidatus Omnitrophota bacterium]